MLTILHSAQFANSGPAKEISKAFFIFVLTMITNSIEKLQTAEFKLSSFLKACDSNKVELIKQSHYKYLFSKKRTLSANELDAFENNHHVTLPVDFRFYLEKIGTSGIYYFDHAGFLYWPQKKIPVNAYESAVMVFLTTSMVELLVKSGFSATEIENCDYDHITKRFNDPQIQKVFDVQDDKNDLLTFGLILESGGCGGWLIIILNGIDQGKIAYQLNDDFKEIEVDNTLVEIVSYTVKDNDIFELLEGYINNTIRNLVKITTL